MLEIGRILDTHYVVETGLKWNLKDDDGVIEEYSTRTEAEEDLDFILNGKRKELLK